MNQTTGGPLCLKNLEFLDDIAKEDAAGLKKAAESYGDSWKKRGGTGAFMMLCRKWDRIENALDPSKAIPGKEPDIGMAPMDVWKTSNAGISVPAFDILQGLMADERGEGLIDDIRDLRRYLMLIESEAKAQGALSAHAAHRDNPEERHDDSSVEKIRKGLATGGGMTTTPVLAGASMGDEMARDILTPKPTDTLILPLQGTGIASFMGETTVSVKKFGPQEDKVMDVLVEMVRSRKGRNDYELIGYSPQSRPPCDGCGMTYRIHMNRLGDNQGCAICYLRGPK